MPDRHDILRISGTDWTEMTTRLMTYADVGEMLRKKAEILHKEPREMRIALKPNLISCTPAMYGATTHPELLDAAVRYILAAGFPAPVIMEGSWVGDRTADAFEYCGYNALAAQYGLTLIDTQKEPGIPVDCSGIQLNICRCALEADFLINFPVLKGHCQTKVTCALKNMKGLIPNSEKRRFHTMGLHKPIAHLNTILKPDLIITDHICGDPDFEEGGNPLIRNSILLSTDPVLTDAYAASLLGYRPEEIGYIRFAADLGVGCMDLRTMRLTDMNSPVIADILPETRRLMEVSYPADAVDSCSACYGMLIGALRTLRDEGLLDRLPCRVCIGQGYRGKSGPYGIGNCTRGFDRFIPGCPPDESTILRELRQWICDSEQT